MRKTPSFEGILAALAVLSASATTIGCSKSESARPVEETKETPAAATATASASSPVAPLVAATAAPAPAVDAGKELEGTPPSSPSSVRSRGPSASCGAQGCSPEMKKGK